jgi:tRNA A58 N-methylase Trm61
VLEIGTGSGYTAAMLAIVAKEVYSIERHKNLAYSACQRLKKFGYQNTHVLCADGSLGWPNEAPFDAIVVTAGVPDADHINHYISSKSSETLLDKASFTRIPTWMWANHSVLAFSRWLLRRLNGMAL